jgi:hypothetical protein
MSGRFMRATALIFVISAVCTGTYIIYRVNPAESAWFPPCPFHALTGLYCPGCGSGRALHHLLHGEVPAALALNPLMVVLLPVMIVWALINSLPSLFARIYTRVAPLGRWAWVVPAVLALYWIARNIPCHPFNILAPRVL